MTSQKSDRHPLPVRNGNYNLEEIQEDNDTKCGLGNFRPAFLQVFARIGAFIGIYSASGLLTSTLNVYVNSQVSMLEKQFGFSSAQTGVLMSCNDIGYLCTVMLAGYVTKKVHIPKGLGFSTILFGVCGILCALPYFIQDSSAFDLEVSTSGGNTTHAREKKVPMCDLSNSSGNTVDSCSASSVEGAYNLEQLWLKKMAYALIAVGMVLQGIGKSPRYPFVTVYIDDAVSKQKTGFYMGIIIGTGIFGPALAYLMGGVFSKIYVTLASVPITPSDPRWIGAWWLGFLIFGGSAICFSLPLMCFPRRLRSKSRRKEADMMEKEIVKTHAHQKKSSVKFVLKEIKDYGTSVIRIFKNPAYALLSASTVINIIGVAGTLAFMPKYFASQYSMPLWKANMIMACCSILAVSMGSFVGGVISRRVKMTPLNTCKMILLFFAVFITTQVFGFFLGCDQPVLHGDNNLHEPSPLYKLTENHCNTNCHCDESSYFPICGDDGRSYFSPCHTGCTSQSTTDFNNCTCIPSGHAIAGLCDQGCNTKLYIYAVIMFIGKLFTAFKIIPIFIGKLRSVEERDRATSTATSSFLTSTLGWMPGPVIFGAIIDNTCSLWKYTCGERQSCKLYDIVYFRNILHAYSLVSSVLAALMIVILYAYFKITGKNVWLGEKVQKPIETADPAKEIDSPVKNDHSDKDHLDP